MQQLYRFIYRNRSFLSFLLLLSLGFFLVVRFNQYPAAVYFHTSNQVSGNLLGTRQQVLDYFYLGTANRQLADENAALRRQLLTPIAEGLVMQVPVLTTAETFADQYDFIPAKVINNSVHRFRNYITLNKGSRDGIEPGMGVMGPQGVVGQVDFVSRNFATVISLLHADWQVSSLLPSTGSYCTINWRGVDPQAANLLYLPLHTEPAVGDSVVTSGFDAIFPQGTAIGKIRAFEQSTDANFYDVKVDLATDFTALSYVYVVSNAYRAEQDSLQQLTDPSL